MATLPSKIPSEPELSESSNSAGEMSEDSSEESESTGDNASEEVDEESSSASGEGETGESSQGTNTGTTTESNSPNSEECSSSPFSPEMAASSSTPESANKDKTQPPDSKPSGSGSMKVVKLGLPRGSVKTGGESVYRNHRHNLPANAHKLSTQPRGGYFRSKPVPVKRCRRGQLTICLSNCRYETVRRVSKQFNLVEVHERDDWNVFWTDYTVSLERAMDMRRFQICNHFPGMSEICRKDFLARNLNRMKKLFPKEYDIYPKTWGLPADLGDLRSYARRRNQTTFILKPDNGCQGRGIYLVRGVNGVKDLTPNSRIICQLYLDKPFLIDGYKFDLRIYVLMTSCDPLRIYVYEEGLGRFATNKYHPPRLTNTDNPFMHLTNYAVNKHSLEFCIHEEKGSKRKLTSVYNSIGEAGHDVTKLIADIDDVIIKTIISAHPVLKHNYRTSFPNHDVRSACFEILGFDILLDQKLKPYVLEVNHSPSFHTDSPLDMEIKEALLTDTFAMLNLKKLDRIKLMKEERKRVQDRLMQKKPKRSVQDALPRPATAVTTQTQTQKSPEESPTNPFEIQFAHEIANCGRYRLVYPFEPDSGKYDRFFEPTKHVFQQTASSQARVKFTRSQLDEINRRKLSDENKGRMIYCGTSEKSLLSENSACTEAQAQGSSTKGSKVNKSQPVVSSSFVIPGKILAQEQIERMKDDLSRARLVRKLGIEGLVFQLLCLTGDIKPREELAYMKMYGNPKLRFRDDGGGSHNQRSTKKRKPRKVKSVK